MYIYIIITRNSSLLFSFLQHRMAQGLAGVEAEKRRLAEGELAVLQAQMAHDAEKRAQVNEYIYICMNLFIFIYWQRRSSLCCRRKWRTTQRSEYRQMSGYPLTMNTTVAFFVTSQAAGRPDLCIYVYIHTSASIDICICICICTNTSFSNALC